MASPSVIIVSYNSSDCIAACLRAIRAAPEWKVILVDNASSDSTVAIARSAAPDLCIVQNGDNRGFAAAVNQGFQAADSDVCVLLNPDAIARPGSLDRLAQEISKDNVAAVGGALTTIQGEPEKGFTVRRFPTLASALAEVLLLNRLWPRNPINRRYRYLDLDYNLLQEVEQPAGACLAIKRQAWEGIGGFDETFFPVWFEEVDFCRRLSLRGWKILYCPEAVFVHSGGHSVQKLSFKERQAFWYRNLLRYFIKHHSRTDLFVLRIAVAAGLLLRSAFSFFGLRPSGLSVRQALSAYLGAAWSYAIPGKGLHLNTKGGVITFPVT